MGYRELSSVGYKKGSWMRYSLWALAGACIGILIFSFINMMNSEVSASIPSNYKFLVTDNYAVGSKIRTTYYVYDNHILVEDESFEKDATNRVVIIYDNINTEPLKYDENDKTKICELGACYERPKVLAVIKKLISSKMGREYIGL